MFSTRTGNFPIGFRRGWSDWQKDLDGTLAWAKANGLGVIDLGGDADTAGAAAQAAGMRVGSGDLKNWSGFISADADKRAAAVEANRDYIAACVKVGVTNFFAVMLPEDASKPRKENFPLMVEGLKALAPVLEANGAKLVIEGWPGNGALCCTPESYRATFEAVGSDAIGINYDPSHLIRMGIDPIRFLKEFADRVFHVHGKDTAIDQEAVYEYGTEISSTLGHAHGFGSTFWRYTIPGHGITPWTEVFAILKDRGYQGCVSIELEDENFNGTEAGERFALIAGAQVLAGA